MRAAVFFYPNPLPGTADVPPRRLYSARFSHEFLPAPLCTAETFSTTSCSSHSPLRQWRWPEIKPQIAPPPPLIAPPDDFVGLARWRRAARRPLVDVTANDSATVRFLARAIAENQSVCFRYAGGELHRLKREVTPGALFRVDDFPGTYVSGYCHLQQAERTFSVERISDLRPAALDPIIYSEPPTEPRPRPTQSRPSRWACSSAIGSAADRTTETTAPDARALPF